MKTLAWYTIEARLTALELGQLIRANEFSRDSTQGYIVNTVTDQQVSAVYVSRRRSDKSFNDIFGNEIRSEIVEYVEVEFMLDFRSSYIQILSGKSGIKALLANLSSTSNFKIGFANIFVDVTRWAQQFLADIDIEMATEKIVINDLQYPRARGRLEITCEWSVSDIDEQVSLLRQPESRIERLRLRSPRPHSDLRSIMFDRSGFCRIHASPGVLDRVATSSRQALLQARF